MSQTPDGVRTPSVAMQMIPIMFCFFSMGFVDTGGNMADFIRRIYADNQQPLSDTLVNIFPSLVFFCFLIFSIPAGLLMNKIGRKKTVLWSLIITLIALILPMFGEQYGLMLIVCVFLGVGNTFMQVSLNPLVSNVIAPQKLASTLTFGQFVKAFTGILAPVIAGWGYSALQAVKHAGEGTSAFDPTFGLGWRIYFPIYALICLLSFLLLGITKIREEKMDKVSGFKECFVLLGRPFIFMCFLGIICHVGLDVGVNSTAPRLLEDALAFGMADDARATFLTQPEIVAATSFAITFYFIFRAISCFLGSIFLRFVPAKNFFLVSAIMVIAGLGCLCFGGNGGKYMIYAGIALVALGNSNLFSVIFTQCLVRNPNEGNEISGLMIMGLFGGTIFPIAMGIGSDWLGGGQLGGVLVLCIAGLFMLYFTSLVKNINTEEAKN